MRGRQIARSARESADGLHADMKKAANAAFFID